MSDLGMMSDLGETKSVEVKHIPVKEKKGGKIYKRYAPAVIDGRTIGQGECALTVTEKKGSREANSVFYENVSRAKAMAYLQALAWQGKCHNGVSIMYYTVK